MARSTDARPSTTGPGSDGIGTRLDRLARRMLLRQLERVGEGELVLVDGAGEHRFGDPETGPSARVTVHRARFFRRLVTGGALGVGGAYIDGDWDADELAALFRLFLRNQAWIGRLDSGGARVATAIYRLGQWLRRNTPAGSRRNIRDHYDLGNDLFRLFLDESMTYSCALFDSDDADLASAQRAKLDRICRKLELGPDKHVLEIGTGWASFAIVAAAHYGCHVTTTTISPAQYALARERIEAAGVGDRITLLQSDYRDLEGIYDRIVSIEMIEAVGASHLPTFLRHCAARLHPEGRLLLQVISTGEQYYDQYRRSVDFIQHYVFPGSHCPALRAVLAATGGASDLRASHVEDLTPDYVLTLRHWRANFRAAADEVRALGYPERFLRLWDYYLQYCEAGFAERHIADLQVIMDKPACNARPIRPAIPVETTR
jgi:cyclopropane-fatty-acyl-phospholipid synthase